ncbi:hypothetical protein [Pasteurella multocida]|uniref:hypothetical protein n=1 Tax=Pasteurella multocida TaxID=747 RepID=UPI0020213E13|nr:hypothetical protein [Pasteurella multocida]MCL7799341.1 hypothetical protein [Pasteurella multocida]MCL7806275.1 hypothetical protein [Pasteurella multocida]MCL7807673.1 hypothetical protein [Pasteurella multocida]MCL7809470.1 hypothetical protein [Pasteurella multocida]MCL7814208.1 hypothetical protein [Pasteurella multocida]
MLTERITLPNGTIIEFFASTPEQMKLMLPSYRYAEEKITQQRQAKKKKQTKKQIKKARRKNRR